MGKKGGDKNIEDQGKQKKFLAQATCLVVKECEKYS
jgi:hypothetical protein